MNTLKCLIIEDQRPAQRLLESYIKELPNLTLEQTCGSAIEALPILQSQPVDLIFLDLHLPKLDGFDFLKGLPNPPKVIVTTAYSDYAVEGFELNVVDYLLKPFSFERFMSAVSKVKQVVESPGAAGPAETAAGQPEQQDLFVKLDGAYHRVAISDIIYLQSDGDFVNLVTVQRRYFLHATLTSWVEKLANEPFVRVHRSYLVNLNHILRITNNRVITREHEIPIGRVYKEALMGMIGSDL